MNPRSLLYVEKWPGVDFRWGRYSSLHRLYSDVAKYIFDIYYLLTMLFVYWFLWPLRLVLMLVCCLYKVVYLQIFKCVSFWLHGCCGEWEGGPVNQVNHTSWLAVVTPTDRPKSVRNCCLIELFCGLFVMSLCPFDISVGVGAFVKGLGQISSFLSLYCNIRRLIIPVIYSLRSSKRSSSFSSNLPINIRQLN